MARCLPPAEQRRQLVQLLEPLLASVPEPDTISSFRLTNGDFFALLDPSAVRHIHSALSHTAHILAVARKQSPLFLVPAAWKHRMMQAVSGHLYLAQIRHWS